MEFQFPPINYLYLVAAVLSGTMAAFSLRRAPGRSGLLWLLVLSGFVVWNAGEFIANSGVSLSWHVGFQRLVYLGAIVSVAGWFLFTLVYAGYERWVTRPVLATLLVIPLCSALMVLTLDWHGLLYEQAALVVRNGYRVLDVEHGAGYWVLVLGFAYPYTIAGSVLLLVTSLRRPGVYQAQSLLVSVAALFPLVSDILYLSGVVSAGGYDPTPLFFLPSAVLVTFATRRYQFLSLMPVARDRVFETIAIPVVVCNRNGQISDANPAFLRLTGLSWSEHVGRSLRELLAECFDGEMLDMDQEGLQGRLVAPDGKRLYDISAEALSGSRHESLGTLVMLHDVTEVQEALERIGHLTDTDSLTDRTGRHALEAWSGQRGRQAGDLVVVADIDHFRRVNDSHGPDFGDFVLSEVADLMSGSLRPDDNIARWGGEEFCIVLSRTPLTAGRVVVERLRRMIEQHDFQRDDVTVHVTMTFGIVEQGTDEPLEEAIRRADLLMYVGKQDGRNRVVAGE